MSQYDLEKELEEKQNIELEYHGEATMVRLHRRDAGKTEVVKGDVVKVSLKTAKALLRYSSLWTLKDDKPVDQPHLRSGKDSGVKKEKETVDFTDLTPEAVEEMKKPKVIELLELLQVKFNKRALVEKLKELLLASIDEVAEDLEIDPDADAEDGDEAKGGEKKEGDESEAEGVDADADLEEGVESEDGEDNEELEDDEEVAAE